MGILAGATRSAPTAHDNIEADVLIIGAGITGAMVGDSLTEVGYTSSSPINGVHQGVRARRARHWCSTIRDRQTAITDIGNNP